MNHELTPPRPSRVPRLAVAAAVIAASVGIVAFGASLASGGQQSSSGFAIPLVSTATPSPAANGGGRQGDGGWKRPGRMGQAGRVGPGQRMGEITITAISGNQLSLKTADGWTRTIDATGATVTKAGQTIAVSALQVGDQVVFRETRQADGTFRIDSIRVVIPRVDGTVTAVGTSTVTVRQPNGTSKTVTLTSSTTYHLAGQAATKAALVAGVRVDIQGTTAAGGTFTATDVMIAPAAVAGTVTAKTSDTITVKDRAGTTVTIRITPTTTYRVPGVSSPTLANVAVGDVVVAQGTMNADGSLSASVVRAGAAGTFGPGGHGGFGPMMGGRGMRGWGGAPGPGATTSPSTPGNSGASSSSGTNGA